jgi:hypothetical protein
MIDCYKFLFAASLVTALLELVNHIIEVGITSAKHSCEPVSTALDNSLPIGEHLKLTDLAGGNHGINAEPLLNEGHETRDLGFVVLSRRAGKYLNVHFCSPTFLVAIQVYMKWLVAT